MSAKLTIIRGIPGSGKSTFAKKMIDRNMADLHYEADMYFLDKDGIYRYDPSKIAFAHSWCKSKVLKALSKGFRVIVSNTFTRRSEMEPYITYCIDNGIPFEVIRLETQYGNIHNVPKEVLSNMKSRFQDFPNETILK